jgi:hypothetical protein
LGLGGPHLLKGHDVEAESGELLANRVHSGGDVGREGLGKPPNIQRRHANSHRHLPSPVSPRPCVEIGKGRRASRSAKGTAPRDRFRDHCNPLASRASAMRNEHLARRRSDFDRTLHLPCRRPRNPPRRRIPTGRRLNLESRAKRHLDRNEAWYASPRHRPPRQRGADWQHTSNCDTNPGKTARKTRWKSAQGTIVSEPEVKGIDDIPVPVNKVISARSRLRRPASDGPMDGKAASDPDSPTGLAAAALVRRLPDGSWGGRSRGSKRVGAQAAPSQGPSVTGTVGDWEPPLLTPRNPRNRATAPLETAQVVRRCPRTSAPVQVLGVLRSCAVAEGYRGGARAPAPGIFAPHGDWPRTGPPHPPHRPLSTGRVGSLEDWIPWSERHCCVSPINWLWRLQIRATGDCFDYRGALCRCAPPPYRRETDQA